MFLPGRQAQLPTVKLSCQGQSQFFSETTDHFQERILEFNLHTMLGICLLILENSQDSRQFEPDRYVMTELFKMGLYLWIRALSSFGQGPTDST